MPKLEWKHEGANPKMQLTIRADPAPKAARLWSAQSATRDFRLVKWSDRPLEVSGKTITGGSRYPG